MKDKKSIIVSEILFWKQNQMLPERYCDFLLALYEQGETESQPPHRNKSILARKSNSLVLQVVMVMMTIVAIGMIVAVNSVVLSTIVALLTAILLFFLGAHLLKKTLKAPVIYVLFALLLLSFSLKIWLLYYAGHPDVLIGIMIGNCILWIVAGKIKKQVYLLISGSAGLLITLYYLFF